MQIPPGSASASRRAATLTPSPKMSSSSTMTSPRLMPMRNLMRRSSGSIGLAVDHPALHLGGAAHRVDDAGEFRQHAVAGVLDDAAPVLLDLRIDQLPEMRLEALVRAFLVRAHQARIARHIGGEDRGETAGRGHGSGSPPCSGLSFGKIISQLARRDRLRKIQDGRRGRAQQRPVDGVPRRRPGGAPEQHETGRAATLGHDGYLCYIAWP